MLKTKGRKRPGARKRTTRVTVDMPQEKHKRLKAIAALKGETLQKFILTCVEEKLSESESSTKLEQLETLGLLGALEESEVTSENYKESIKSFVRKKHGR